MAKYKAVITDNRTIVVELDAENADDARDILESMTITDIEGEFGYELGHVDHGIADISEVQS